MVSWLQAWRVKPAGGSRSGSGRVEARIAENQCRNSSILDSSRPFAQVGERFPPTPTAKSVDSAKMQSSENKPIPSTHTPFVRNGVGEDRKIVATISAGLLEDLRISCERKATVTLLGRVQGKHPGLKTLTAWARETLHPSITLLSLKANNVFEITFGSPEGRTQALTQADLTCETASIFLSSWRPQFDPKKTQDTDSLDYPVWVQIGDLCQVLRIEAFLREIGAQIGQVISIDNSEAYKAKLFGPRIRLLMNDLHNLPQAIIILRLDGHGTMEYMLEFSGLPHQCGRCRSHDHQVRHCPRKDHPRRRDTKPHQAQQQPRSSSNTGAMPQNLSNRASRDTTEEIQETGPDNNVPHMQAATVTPLVEPRSPAAPSIATTLIPDDSPNVVTPEVTSTSAGLDPGLHTNDQNFPKLPSTHKTPTGEGLDNSTTPPNVSSSPPAHFIRRSKPPSLTQEATEDGREIKGKTIAKVPDSTPITRQGYRSGRLADDFWTSLDLPNTPHSQRKTLQVIPFLLMDQNRETAAYLADKKTSPHQPIA